LDVLRIGGTRLGAGIIGVCTRHVCGLGASQDYSPLARSLYVDHSTSLFGWLVADGWCWFLLREEYCWLVASGWFVVREKYCWLVADKPNEQGGTSGVPTAN
jgi:hypothetical protein